MTQFYCYMTAIPMYLLNNAQCYSTMAFARWELGKAGSDKKNTAAKHYIDRPSVADLQGPIHKEILCSNMMGQLKAQVHTLSRVSGFRQPLPLAMEE